MPRNVALVTQYRINSESEAWDLLRKVLTEGVPDGAIDIKFENWPKLVFCLKGDKFDSSLTTKTMQYFIELQRNINSAYAQLRYNRPNAAGLSNDEREELEIIVKVEKGSSLFEVNCQKAVENILHGVISKMTGTELVISILGLALIAGGVLVAKAYISQQGRNKEIDAIPTLSANETERMKIFADAIKKQDKLIPIYEDAEETYNDLLKSATEAEYLEIGGHKITSDMASQIIRQKREKSAEVQLNGEYRILSVDSSKAEGFVIGLRSVDDKREFTAVLEDKFIFRRDANLDVIKNAEWGKTHIYLRVNGKELRGAVNQAVIVDVGR